LAVTAALLMPLLAPALAAPQGCGGRACCAGEKLAGAPPCHRPTAAWSAAMDCCRMSQAPAVPAPAPTVVEPPVWMPASIGDVQVAGIGPDRHRRMFRDELLARRHVVGLFTLHASFLN
jgi:hypothetical protein